jgi:hypothetical protein
VFNQEERQVENNGDMYPTKKNNRIKQCKIIELQLKLFKEN